MKQAPDARPSKPRIDSNDDAQVERWAFQLGIDPETLRQAIREVGDRADMVAEHLDTMRRIAAGRAAPTEPSTQADPL